MFNSSANRRRPAAKPTAASTTTPAAPAATLVSSSTASRKVKVATVVTRTVVQHKKVVPLPSPRPPPPTLPAAPLAPAKANNNTTTTTKKLKSSPAPLKRKPTPLQAREPAGGDKKKQKRVQSSSSSASQSDSDSSSASDSDSATSSTVHRLRESSPVVARSTAAALDAHGVTVVTGADLVAKSKAAYVPYFSDPGDQSRLALDWAGSSVPTVVLEYPGKGAVETFSLLVPRHGDEYDPVDDIMSTIRLVLDHFLTPAQSLALFAHSVSSNSFSAFLSAPPSRSATPSTPTDSTTPSAAPVTPLMRSLEKAKARRDGPAFLAEIERYNTGIRLLKGDGTMASNIEAMKGVRTKVWSKVVAQVYDRAVGPEIEELRKYEAFSDNVYGELLPKFMGEIFQQTGVGPNSVFVDLGSGVGNCVVQAALATGCEAWGFENMAHASSLARAQLVEAEARFRMWGLSSGAMKVVEADFCESPEVGQVLKRADVVLVNNEVFSSSLNERLSLLFLDLRSGTKIVSLKAFASSFTLSAHNRHSPLAILRQGPERHYSRKSVSWKDEGGTYFIGTVDRKLLQTFDKREEKRKQKRDSEQA